MFKLINKALDALGETWVGEQLTIKVSSWAALWVAVLLVLSICPFLAIYLNPLLKLGGAFVLLYFVFLPNRYIEEE